MIGSPGHNKTVNWIYDTMSKYPDYYTVKYQPFDLSLATGANLTENDTPLEVFGVSLAPAGTATGKIVAIPNLACDAVCNCGPFSYVCILTPNRQIFQPPLPVLSF